MIKYVARDTRLVYVQLTVNLTQKHKEISPKLLLGTLTISNAKIIFCNTPRDNEKKIRFVGKLT